MSKFSAVRFFAVVIAVLCIGARVSADVQLKGPETKQIVVDKESLDYKINYTGAYSFYNTTDKKQDQYYALHVGGCKLEFWAGWCRYTDVGNRDQNVKRANGGGYAVLHDDFPYGTVESSSINIHAYDYLDANPVVYQTYRCNAQFDSNVVPGKYVINVSFTGEVAPNLVANFIGAELFVPTTLAPASTPAPKKLEVWQIALIVAGSVIILLAVIVLCIVVICCYRKKKAKAQKVAESEHSTAASTMGTTVGAFTTRETDLYGPDLMHISKNITQGEQSVASQAVSPGPQATSPAPQAATSPAPPASPMQAAK